jgi:hypothetical protein
MGPPSTLYEALRPTPTHQMDGGQPPNQADIVLGAVEGVYGPQNTPILWQCALSEQRSTLRAIHTLNNPKNYTHLLRGLSPIHLMHRQGAQGLMWGAMGSLPPAAAMVIVVATSPAAFPLATGYFSR